MTDTESLHNSASMSLTKSPLLEKPCFEEFRWSQRISVTSKSRSEVQEHCFYAVTTHKTDDGNHLNRVSHWQQTLKKNLSIKLATRLVLGKASMNWNVWKEWQDPTTTKWEKSWENLFKNTGSDFRINCHYSNHATGLEVGMKSSLNFSVFHKMRKVLMWKTEIHYAYFLQVNSKIMTTKRPSRDAQAFAEKCFQHLRTSQE